MPSHPAPQDPSAAPARAWRHPVLEGSRQLAVILAFWLLGTGLASLPGWPQLGGVAGMALLGLALQLRLLGPGQVRDGAAWLMTHMLLFFIPAVLVVLDHRELLGWVGLKLFGAIVAGTLMVMAATALSVEWCLRWGRRRRALARLRRLGARHAA